MDASTDVPNRKPRLDALSWRPGPALLPYVFILLAFVLRIINITGESLWRDEIDTIRFSLAPLTDLTHNLIVAGFNGPLYLIFIKAWLALGGVNDLNLRYFSLLCGVLQLALLHAFVRLTFRSPTARYALWLMAISPVLIWYSGEGKMYTLQLMLITLGLYSLRRAVLIEDRGVNLWWLVFIVSVSLGYYTHLLSPLFLPVAICFFLAWWQHSRKHRRGAIVAVALCTLPYVPLALWQIPAVLHGSDTGHVFYPLTVMVFTLAYNWTLGLSDEWLRLLPYGFVISIVLSYASLVALGLLGVLPNVKVLAPATDRVPASGKERPVLGLILSMLVWLLLPTVILYAISTRTPLFEARYVLWSAPTFYILIGASLVWTRKRFPLVAAALLVAVSLVGAIGIFAQVLHPIRPDIRGAARYVAGTLQSDDLYVFLIPYTKFGIEYYVPQLTPDSPLESGPLPVDGLRTVTGLRERSIDAPYTNAGAMPDDVAAQLLPLLQRTHRIWLIEMEVTLWDQRGLVQQWFDSHMIELEQHRLNAVTVTLYKTP